MLDLKQRLKTFTQHYFLFLSSPPNLVVTSADGRCYSGLFKSLLHQQECFPKYILWNSAVHRKKKEAILWTNVFHKPLGGFCVFMRNVMGYSKHFSLVFYVFCDLSPLNSIFLILSTMIERSFNKRIGWVGIQLSTVHSRGHLRWDIT